MEYRVEIELPRAYLASLSIERLLRAQASLKNAPDFGPENREMIAAFEGEIIRRNIAQDVLS